MAGGWWLFETPANAFVRFSCWWVWLLYLGAIQVTTPTCGYQKGPPYVQKKLSILGNAPWLVSLRRACCGKKHKQINSGSAAAKSAEYHEDFCDKVAEGAMTGPPRDMPSRAANAAGAHVFSASSADGVAEAAGESEPETDMPAQAGLFEGGPLGPSYLWAIQTSEALNWKVIVQQPFRKVRHINLQEGSVEGLVVRRAPWRRRILILEDSEVTLAVPPRGDHLLGL
jgi:hypothetical protein